MYVTPDMETDGDINDARIVESEAQVAFMESLAAQDFVKVFPDLITLDYLDVVR